jgi:hypothetical protein
LKGLLEGETSKDVEVCNNLPPNTTLNFDISENIRGAIKNERVYSHTILETLQNFLNFK